jgi:predicted RND superfamily exporter protein
MTVLVEPEVAGVKVLEQPEVVRGIDSLARFIGQQSHVGNVANIGYLIKLNNAFIHDDDEGYLRVPDTKYAVGQMLLNIADRSPGVYSWLFTNDLSSCVVIAYVDSTNPRVVEHVLGISRKEAEKVFRGLPVKVGVAGGSIGIASAFNHNVRYWLLAGSLLGLCGTFILAMVCIRSVFLSFILLIPLAIGTVLALAVMSLAGIEVNSNAISALAIASGVGIDSEVYLLFRVREEFGTLRNFREALVRGYVKIRRALVVSNGALIFGCWALIPVPLYIGYVGFGMGLVLLSCFVMSAILSPILWSWFGERAVIGRGISRGVDGDIRGERGERRRRASQP